MSKQQETTSVLSAAELRKVLRSKDSQGLPDLRESWHYKFRVAGSCSGKKVLVAEIWDQPWAALPFARRKISFATVSEQEVEICHQGSLRRSLRALAEEVLRRVPTHEPFTYEVVRRRLAQL